MSDISLTIILKGITDVKRQLDSVGSTMKKVGSDLSQAGRALTIGVTAPILGLGAAAIKSSADFQKAMTESMAIMGDLSETTKKEMSDTAREVAKNTRFSATQAAESYFYLASAGLDAQQSIASLPQVAKFAQAGNFDMALATDLLTDAQSALGLTIRDDVNKNMQNMIALSDVLVKANTLSNATVQQFSESLTNRAGAALKQVNKSMEEGVAVLAAFADQGVKGQVAGQALFMVLRDLQTAVISNRSEFDKMGITVYDSNGKLANMSDIIGDLEGAFGGLSDEQKKMALAQLGFTDRSQAFLLTLLGTSDAIRKYQAGLEDAGGITDEVANKQIQNFWDQLGLLQHRLTDIAIDLGDTLLPVLSDLIDQLGPVVEKIKAAADWFVKLGKEGQKNVLMWVAIAAAAGPVLLVLGGLFTTVGSLITIFARLFGAIQGGIVVLRTFTVAATAAKVSVAGWTGAIALAVLGSAELVREINNNQTKALENLKRAYEGVNSKTDKYVKGQLTIAVGVKQVTDWQIKLGVIAADLNVTWEEASDILAKQDAEYAKFRESLQGLAQDYKDVKSAASDAGGGTPEPPPTKEDFGPTIKSLQEIIQLKDLNKQYDAEYFESYRKLLQKQFDEDNKSITNHEQLLQKKALDEKMINALIAQEAVQHVDFMIQNQSRFFDFTTEGMLDMVKEQKYNSEDISDIMAELGKRYAKESKDNEDAWHGSLTKQAEATGVFTAAVEIQMQSLGSAIKGIWHGTEMTAEDAWKNALDVFVDVMVQMVIENKLAMTAIEIQTAAATAGLSLAIGLLASLIGGGGSHGPSKLQQAKDELKNSLEAFLDNIEQALNAFADKTSTTLEKLTTSGEVVDTSFSRLVDIITRDIPELQDLQERIDTIYNQMTELEPLSDEWVSLAKEAHDLENQRKRLEVQLNQELIDNEKIILDQVQKRYDLEISAIEDIQDLLESQKEFTKDLDSNITDVQRALLSPEEMFQATLGDINALRDKAAAAGAAGDRQGQLEALGELQTAYNDLFSQAQSLYAEDPDALKRWQDFVVSGLQDVKDSGIDAYDEMIDLEISQLVISKEQLDILKNSNNLEKDLNDLVEELNANMEALLGVPGTAGLLEQLKDATPEEQQGILDQIGQALAGLGISLSDIPQYGTGAYIKKPTLAVVGDRGPEYITPEGRMGGINVAINGPFINDEISMIRFARELERTTNRERVRRGF